MTSQHSYLPPSGAAAWRHCAMWPTMNALYPQEDTPEILEGHAAHFVMAEMLAGHPVKEGEVDPAGTVINDEMIEGAQLLVDAVHSVIAPGVELHVEKPVSIQRIHKDCWGTPDVWAFDSSTYHLYIWDYKYGHRFVDEYENDQGVAYIAGIIDKLAVDLKIGGGELDQMISVDFTIVQPRCFYKGTPVRTWTVQGVDLRGHINQLANAAFKATDPTTKLREAKTNAECLDCPGSHACEALQLAGYSDAEFAVTSSPVELSPENAALELKMMERSLERLQARVEGLRENIASYIRQGRQVPYYHVEQGYGRKQWTLPADQLIAMGNLMGVNLAKVSAITPNQALKNGIDESVIKAYSHTPLGSLKLVPTTSADARRVFGNNK